MAILMGKFKNQEWEEIERSPAAPNHQQRIIQEYKDVFGQGWMFEWRDEEKIEEQNIYKL